MGPVPRPIGVSWMPCGLVRASVCVRGCMGLEAADRVIKLCQEKTVEAMDPIKK